MAGPGKADRRSDQELVRICNTGNAPEAVQAFEALYRRHRNYVVRVALRFVRDPDTALDVLQETFSYLLGKFPPAGDGLVLTAHMTTFLYPVAKHCALSLLRKQQRFPSAEGRSPDELAAEPVADEGDLAVVLRGLSAERREVVLMRFADGMSLEDIATALGIPLGTVKSRLHIAIRQLRESSEINELRDA